MLAVILCPGPSLEELTEIPPCELSIAVNRAVLRFPVTWWAAVDYPMIRDNRAGVLGDPKLLTGKQTWEDIGRKVAPFPEVMHVETLEECYPGKYDRRTTPSAILLAAWLGATEIHLYGDDRTQAADFDGHKNAETMMARDPERWAAEARDCDAIFDWLRGKDVEVFRFFLPGFCQQA